MTSSGQELEVYRTLSPVSAHSRLTEYGLVIDEGVSTEELFDIGRAIVGQLQALTDWALGDWAVRASNDDPDGYRDYLRDNPLKGRIEKCRATSEAFPEFELRARYGLGRDENGRPVGLTWSHFETVARMGVEGARRDDFLSTAMLDSQTPRQLAVNIRDGVSVPQGADDAPAVPRSADSQPSWIYPLGPHRLMCGDATDPWHLHSLFSWPEYEVVEEKAALVWTDPPYGVDYVGKTKSALTIANDMPSDTRDLLRDAFLAAQDVCAPTTPFYIAGPSGDMGLEFRIALKEAGWNFEQTLIWVKDQFVLGRMDYHWKHEDILYGHLPGPYGARGVMNPQRWFGNNNEDTVFQVQRPRRSEEHPTMKPVDLIVQHIRNSSRDGDIVLDMFAGSGSTLIAAELTGRRAFLMELDPGYCDVIRNRYEQFVTQRAEREAVPV